MSQVIVYSKPACVQCTATQDRLIKDGIPHEVIDISVDDDAREKVMALGYSSAPVVVAGDVHWSGFKPDKIKELAALAAV